MKIFKPVDNKVNETSSTTFPRNLSVCGAFTVCVISPPQDRDLDCKLEEVRRGGRSLPEVQVLDWFIQLLLGLHYMHDR